MKPRGIAGKCAGGTKLPARGPCPACGAGPDRECPKSRVAEAEELKRFRAALESIAANTCCEGCQEAAKVARAALQDPTQRALAAIADAIGAA